MGRPILSLDFDGVIHSYTSKWAGADVIPDPPVPGAIAFLREATKHFRVCIYSTRSATEAGREAMAGWLGVWAARDDGDLDWLRRIEFPETKPPALVGIDDRILTFEGEWPSMERLLSFKPWNKRPAASGEGGA
jgi:hypothetical protein